MKLDIREYVDKNGRCPYRKWLIKLDLVSRMRVEARILKVGDSGHMGDVKTLKDGVFELRLFNKTGIRIYFAKDGDKIILLLLGGDKGSQQRDIVKAKDFWQDYKRNNKE